MLYLIETKDKQVGTGRQHSQIQGKFLEPFNLSAFGDECMTDGKSIR